MTRFWFRNSKREISYLLNWLLCPWYVTALNHIPYSKETKGINFAVFQGVFTRFRITHYTSKHFHCHDLLLFLLKYCILYLPFKWIFHHHAQIVSKGAFGKSVWLILRQKKDSFSQALKKFLNVLLLFTPYTPNRCVFKASCYIKLMSLLRVP